MKKNFTEKAQKALDCAKMLSLQLGHGRIGSEHLLYGLVKEGTSIAALSLSGSGVTEEGVLELIRKFVTPEESFLKVKNPAYTPGAEFILDQAEAEASQSQSALTGTEHLLISILKTTDCIASRILNTIGVNYQKLYGEMMSSLGGDVPVNIPGSEVKSESETPTLDTYSRNLTEMAADGKLDPVIGRSDEILRVIEILSRRTKNNPCLIGEPGVGKTAIAEGLARMIADGNVPDTIYGKRLLALDISGMVAGTKFRGEFEERIKRIISEAQRCGDALLFIDELHTIIGAGSAEGSLDAANILKPALARGELQIIGATTIDEYRKHIEKDSALERRFQPVTVEEPTAAETVEILKGLRERYEEHHHVKITDDAIREAAQLSERYITDRFLPDKAIDLIDEACAKVKLASFKKKEVSHDTEEKLALTEEKLEEALRDADFSAVEKLRRKQKNLLKSEDAQTENKEDPVLPVVTEADIAAVVSKWTKVPVTKLSEAEADRIRNLENILHERIVSQDEAVTAIAKAIKRGRVGIKDPRRPIGSFMFLGPTGVGKTELTKALAEAVFGSEDALIRVDMSEFMEKHSVSRLVGSPPGYVGYDEGGQLTDRIRRHPYSVVLFDEIEKAHPDVFNTLLQVLDDGHITDNKGRKINFKNTIIIMTSNAGAQNIITPRRLGFASTEDSERDYVDMKDKVMDEVKTMFKPEFLNRLDEIIVFRQLTKDNMGRIVEIMLSDILKRAVTEMGITFHVTEGARRVLIDAGYDPKFGARPLRRALQTMVEDQLAEEMLEGKIKPGTEVIIDAGEENARKLSFTAVAPKKNRRTKKEN